MAEWVKRECTRGEIDRWGQALIPWWTRRDEPPEELWRGYMIIQNWRSSHALPLLTFRMGLSQRARRIEKGALIAQRLKRFSSVMNKLTREPTMKLSQMQDLGGCRAILSNVDSVFRLASLYRDPVLDTESLFKCYDYINKPKLDGYRGIHIVGRYRAHVEKNECWNGHRIEIQLRSQFQHAFATAVETTTTFTRSRLKFGGGAPKWRRFFSLMGSAIAIREGTPVVPGTPPRVDDLVGEMRELARELKVRQRLRGWTDALRTLPKRSIKNAQWLLLVLDISGKTINVTGFADRKKASDELARIETSGDSQIDAVLVWVNSINQLKSAYPNYYADTAAFLEALEFSLARGNLQRMAKDLQKK
ncbi:MAG: RelA/SpoT domain-containing protein [Anaerolineaceae bacterium]|nr:RelA/SpoT domain-containing protein [Anaerolineaceae bacterium]